MDYTAKELFEILNNQDECDWIEAKGGHESSHSVMETVCAFANEPGLGGGYILLGIAEDKSMLFPQYKSVNIANPDKTQNDFVSQCSSMFNIPIRPKVSVEKINGDTVIKIFVDELSINQKPLYFKSDGLPTGAFRRIGPTDQHCTEDDMPLFYTDYKSYDQTPIKGTSIADIDEIAVKRYRLLREKVNPVAEELSYDDAELLESLGCVNKENKSELNLAGLVLFGTSKALRSYFPMLRVDYIRVPGNKWVEDPDNRFSTIDMRGSLLLMLYRLVDAINSDLPKGFLLPEDGIQASSVGLPTKALREAIVNALMHRSYREHRPIQIIRYDNRIEIINPGFSLKSEEKLGEPGSETRNPFIAAVFHDTNLAETKGSGIRAMRRLMQAAHLVLPTFESSRSNNEFTARLLLHHFLDEKDINWLQQFDGFNLSDAQKQALIFIREVGAIDNQTYRQMADCDTLKASSDLRMLKSIGLFESKGKGKATYYIPVIGLSSQDAIAINPENITKISTQDVYEISTQDVNDISTQDINDISTQDISQFIKSDDNSIVNIGFEHIKGDKNNISTQAYDLSTQAYDLSTQAYDLSTQAYDIPDEIKKRIEVIRSKKRTHDSEKISSVIRDLCLIKPFTSNEISAILGKREDYIRRKFLSSMIQNGELTYLYPEMTHHPEQAYLSKHKKY